ncbi:hypothetical protein LTR05_006582 [Lithohypha guttulata]|uniref:DUF4291 domain-containing protein n=1 Tax=Lithohypha guttulata TaxID=1690604 RepID=A0AAN7Y4K7_9EURO|nr:hypothetical protein LTR05_006582 [Lithohypha guttulata]
MTLNTQKSNKPAQHCQIRAVYDDDTITVYQAYNSGIATAAVEAQRLDASPLFKPARMTWIKPSWNWMMYSYKDSNQNNVLALKVKREFFEELLRRSVESESDETRRDGEQVRVQWDPERNVRCGKLDVSRRVRSIQIGIPRGLKERWVEDSITQIEDVTERARQLKKVLDENTVIDVEELVRAGLLPVERVYTLPEDIERILGITHS